MGRAAGVLGLIGAGTLTPRPVTVRLRPPGALDDPAFGATCNACAKCVAACPAQCIRLDAPASSEDRPLPYIIARLSPCVVCEDLSCMKACPTGALKLVDDPRHIDMGKAVMDLARCLRGGEGDREDCQLCIRDCPMGQMAIGLDERGRVEVRAGCVGCGVCERACPTEPASIAIVPPLGTPRP